MFFPLTLPKRFENTEAEVFFDYFRYYIPESSISWEFIKNPGSIDLNPKTLKNTELSDYFHANIVTIEAAFSSHEVKKPAISIFLSSTEPQIFIHDENFPSDLVEKLNDAVSKSLEKTSVSVKHVGKRSFFITSLFSILLFIGILLVVYFFVLPSPILLIASGIAVAMGLLFTFLIIFKKR